MTGPEVLRTVTLLLVEDDAVFRETVRRMLRPTTFTLLEAATANEATDTARASRPDCVLLDNRLPGRSGLDLVPEFVDAGIPVILMTAEGDEEVAANAIQQGCYAYLPKRRLTAPVLHDQVLHAIHRAALERELTQRRRELEHFVATAAHDLQSPLRHITAFSDLALSMLDAGEVEQARTMIEKGQAAAARLSGLLDSLLAYTSLSTRKVEPEPVDLSTLLQELTDEMSLTLQDVEGHIEFGALPTVWADPALLSIMLRNLLTNAVKYRSELPPRIEVRCDLVANEPCVRVTDNGIGIDSDKLEEIFRPLRRLHGWTAVPGYGIGLATCARIAERIGGRIWAESQPGAGCTVAFTIPQPRKEERCA